MKIYAVCPECGNHNWIHTEEKEFECGACGEIVNPEDMTLKQFDDKCK